MKYNVKVERKENGVFFASCEELPDFITWGATMEEAKKNAEAAIRLHLEEKESPVDREEMMRRLDRLKKMREIFEDEKRRGLLSEKSYSESLQRNSEEIAELEQKMVE